MRTRLRHALVLITLALAAMAACGGDDDDDAGSVGSPSAGRSESSAGSAPAPPPDAGTRTGHADDRPGRVEVPQSDESPPEATILLRSAGGRTLARVAGREGDGEGGEGAVTLGEPKLRGTTVGTDADGGVARVRVSIREEVHCGSDIRLRTRYFPPPQVERIRSTPGALLPTRRSRSVPIELSLARCLGTTPQLIRGELWGEAINGSGLEAVTSHIPFTWSR